jgi:hypothetical protein
MFHQQQMDGPTKWGNKWMDQQNGETKGI